MKPLQKTRWVVSVILLCILLNLTAYALPTTDSFKKNVEFSAVTLNDEGCYPRISSFPSSATQLDNFTDAYIIGAASYDEDTPLLVKFASNFVQDYKVDPVEGLYSNCFGNEPPVYREYSRYWHGYIFFVKSLLYFMQYNAIRQLNSFVQTALFVVVLVLLVKRNRTLLTVPYTVLWLSLNPAAVQASLQFSPIYYVFTIATIILLWRKEQIRDGIGFNIYFLLIGIVTSWIDFLTYPIVALGVPLTVLIVLSDGDLKAKVKLCVTASFMWACGYFGMWAFKWVLSAAILGENVIQTALDSAKFRTSTNIGENTLTKMDVIMPNVYCLLYRVNCILFAAPLIFGGIASVKKHKLPSLQDLVPLLIIALMPFAWYCVFSNHSYIHVFFTFRSLCLSIFAISCFFVNFKKPCELQSGDKNG